MIKELLKDLETLKDQLTKKVKEAKTKEEYYLYIGKLEIVKELLLVRY